MSGGLTLDAGALIALDRNDRRFGLLLEAIVAANDRITIPATALAKAIRNPPSQARISRVLRYPRVIVVPLDREDATAVGVLLAKTRTTDIADAHVVICAQRAQERVVTSDPHDIRRLAPELELVVL